MTINEWNKAMTSWGLSSPSNNFSKSVYKPQDPKVAFRSLLEDPVTFNSNSMGYKDRRNPLPYDVLRRIPQQSSLISAILQTRTHQVSSFSVPYRLSKSLGYAIKTKNPAKVTTAGEREKIQSLETFIYNCGHPKPNPHDPSPFKRDDFETFLKKIVRDSLTFDQTCFEVVPNRKGDPYEFRAVDASSIRIADAFIDDTAFHNNGFGMFNNQYGAPNTDPRMNALTNGQSRYLEMKKQGLKPAYVQVVNGQIAEFFTRDEMAFGVRNPRTDLFAQGYGLSELEMLISIVTAHLNAEEYNSRFFRQGSAPRGILNIKGDAMGPEMLEEFKRMWRATMEGVENSHRTPILQSESGIEWQDLHKTNSDMEYSAWLEYLTKITAAVFLIDPAELNFDMSGGVSQTPLFESSNEWKLKASRDRGLKPLLRFIAKMVNEHIISRIDDDFVFDFVGLDELTEQEKHELSVEQLSSYMTINEVRRSHDLPDIEYGDIPGNPTYAQGRSMLVQEAQQAQAQQGGQPAGNGAAAPPQQEQAAQPTPEGGGDEDAKAPSYADRFSKSLTEDKYLQISFEDNEEWIDIYRG